MRNEMIDRYIYDVTKNYSKSQRNRIKSELAQDIDIKIDELGGAEQVDDRQIREVLLEFGTIQDVAKRYAKNGDRALLPQPYFGTYRSFLWFGIFLAAVWTLAFGAFDLFMAKGVNSFGLNLIPAIKDIVIKLILAVFGVYSIVTISFSLLSKHKSSTKRAGKYVDALKGIPMNGKRTSGLGVYIKFGIITLLTIAFTITPEVFSYEYYAKSALTSALPFFELNYLKANIIFVFIAFFFCVLQYASRLIERRNNGKVLGFTLVSNGILIALVIKTFLLDNAIRPEYIAELKAILPSSGILGGIVSNTNMVVAGILTIILIVDIILTIIAYNKDAKCAKSIISTVPEGDVEFIQEVEPVEEATVEVGKVEEPTEETIVVEKVEEPTENTVVVEKIEEPTEDTVVVEKVEEPSQETVVVKKFVDEVVTENDESTVEIESETEIPTEDTVRVAKVETEEDK